MTGFDRLAQMKDYLLRTWNAEDHCDRRFADHLSRRLPPPSQSGQIPIAISTTCAKRIIRHCSVAPKLSELRTI